MEHFSTETLKDLPLFQGMGKNDLEQFVSQTPHSLVDYNKGATIVSQDMPCQQLIIIIRGTIGMHSFSDNRRYAFFELLHAPLALQPESLYGISTTYTHSYTARTALRALVIPKVGIAQLYRSSEVFRLNLINMLSAKIHKQQQWLWHDLAGNTEKRIVNFIHSRCVYPAGEKELLISMGDLGTQINAPRMKVSKALNNLQKQSLILLQRKKIIIPAIEKLIQAVK